LSPTNDESVSKIVENYHAKFPGLERPLLRRLILAENKGLNTRTLDRHLKKLFQENKPEHEKIPGRLIEKRNLAVTEFREKYQNRFDTIVKTYFSSPEKAWKELREFAATWPEPTLSTFLMGIQYYDPKHYEEGKRLGMNDHDGAYFVSVLDTFKVNLLRALLKDKISDMPQIH
jgi:hypothetical protein